MVRSYDELESMWQSMPPAPRGRGQVRTIVVRTGMGERHCPDSIAVTAAGGLAGDSWDARRDPERMAQVTLMERRVADLVSGEWNGPEMAGDNFLVDLDLSEAVMAIGSRLRIGSVLLEVTEEPHAGCKRFRERFGPGALRWVNLKDHRDRKLRGINCRVVEDGTVAVGDSIEVLGSAKG